MTQSELERAVMAALAEPVQRIRQLELADGRRFWLKRVEQLSGRLRLQKGDPVRSFRAERAGLRALAEKGLPVAAVEMEGPDWILMPDAGPVLTTVVGDPRHGEIEKLRAFAAAGRSLGRLHAAGLVHGRPAVRDICWDGREARFIDMERYRPARQGRFWQAADLVMFAQTCFTKWPDDDRWLGAALETYAANAPADAMPKVDRLARWLTPLGWLAQGLFRLRPKSDELRAVSLTLNRLKRP